MTRIVIIGAGGFGRGVYSWIRNSPLHLTEYNVRDVVFVDDGSPRVPTGAKLVGRISDFKPKPDDRLLCAIASPSIRREVVKRLECKSGRFHTFVDDSATLAGGVRVEEGAIVCPGVVISADARVGKQVHINFNCSIGHDTSLGAFSTLSPSVNVMGEVIVGEGAFLGGSCTILPRLKIGTSSVLGAGSVVVKDVRDELTMIGNPAGVQSKGNTDGSAS